MNSENAAKVWEKTKTGSKAGFDKVWAAFDKLGAPVNRLSNKLGSEAFWPTTLDLESEKAARILRSFCKDGFQEEQEVRPLNGPKQKQRVLKKIPQQVIERAVGLCIFTTMRTGLWASGSGGSGVLVGRLADGSWSPPSGILMHTAGLGFLAGIDIYDCVIVINNRKALEGFTNVRVTLGGEMSMVAGPAGVGGVLDTEVHARQAPLFTYIKSRGLYAGVQFDGTIIIERTDENERFYLERISAHDIVTGKVRHPPYEVRGLLETLKAAEGRTDADSSLIPDARPPGDYEIIKDENGDIAAGTHVFGVPDQEDPDPYGVHALQSEGMEIREAGTRAVPPEVEFEFRPAATSPVNTSFQPAIEKASSRRATISSQNSPHFDLGSFEQRKSVSSTGSLKPEKAVILPKGPPPSLPPRSSVAKAEDEDAVVRPSEEKHLDNPPDAVLALASPTDTLDDQSMIELKDEEATLEADLAEVTGENGQLAYSQANGVDELESVNLEDTAATGSVTEEETTLIASVDEEFATPEGTDLDEAHDEAEHQLGEDDNNNAHEKYEDSVKADIAEKASEKAAEPKKLTKAQEMAKRFETRV